MQSVSVLEDKIVSRSLAAFGLAPNVVHCG